MTGVSGRVNRIESNDIFNATWIVCNIITAGDSIDLNIVTNIGRQHIL